ncbi:hypothetical protein AKJ56_00640 [candidate division MSBL1 archaeon SCGC-AAA382N08]|uniref:Hydrolase TatD n=1 Tax=candidate division MSBL1 archaeon SCGC-AAA382N08 TaxID=1698285 RepID=A0A133VQE2_9EURY|nr:hypothetical protein AKJ56_00640 [candidate division MSBL1 archaeon SCGC-AAA382N08]
MEVETFFDCHWHAVLHDEETIKQKVDYARKVGVDKIIGVPLDFNSSLDLLDISERFAEIYPTAGVHPKNALEMKEEDIEAVTDLLGRSEIVAAGEIGVDKHFLVEKSESKQLKVFRKIMDEAVEYNLPLILHCPRAEPLVFREVREKNVQNAVFHWYTGPLEILKMILDIEGYYVSVTPSVVYSGKMQKTVDIATLDSILLESDGPVEYRDLG